MDSSVFPLLFMALRVHTCNITVNGGEVILSFEYTYHALLVSNILEWAMPNA